MLIFKDSLQPFLVFPDGRKKKTTQNYAAWLGEDLMSSGAEDSCRQPFGGPKLIALWCPAKKHKHITEN